MCHKIRSCLAVCCAIAFSGCLRDDGVSAPADPADLPALVRYRGFTFNEGDTSLDARRLLNLSDPRLTLVWQFVGPRTSISTDGQGTVQATPPYKFAGALTAPPPPEVYASEEPAIGTFWLFSDRNGNGRLDRFLHPDLAAADRRIDSLREILAASRRALYAVSLAPDARTDTQDNFLLTAEGEVYRETSTGPERIMRGLEAAVRANWREPFFIRTGALVDFGKWENFYRNRLQDEAWTYASRPIQGYALEVTMTYPRKLFPAPGQEAEFARRLDAMTAAGLAAYKYGWTVDSITAARAWGEYPYAGFDEPGQDWVAGRARGHFLLYFASQAEVREMQAAQRRSAFLVQGMDRVRTGYNLIACDGQYRCSVRPWDDSIVVSLGSHDAYFNPPSAPAAAPVPKVIPAPIILPAPVLSTYAGEYARYACPPLLLRAAFGDLWGDYPGRGLLRFRALDTTRFYSAETGLALAFEPAPPGQPPRLLAYDHGKRNPWVPTGSAPDFTALDARIAAVADTAPAVAPPPAGAWADILGGYDLGGDTARLGTLPGRSGLAWRGPGTYAEFRLAGPGHFRSRTSEVTLDFPGWPGTRPGRCLESGPGGRISLPAIGYAARSAALVQGRAPLASRVPVDSQGGSGHDTYRGMGGAGRFPASDDGLFLREGDGALASLARGAPVDSISLAPGDRARFRFRGQAGRRLALVLRLRADASASFRRVRISARGGAGPDTAAWGPLRDDDWVDIPPGGGVYELDPVSPRDDDFYLEIGSVITAWPSPAFAIDGYILYREGP